MGALGGSNHYTHCVEKAATAKVSRKPGKSFIDFCPDLQVPGIPVVRQLKLPTDVAKDGNTAGTQHVIPSLMKPEQYWVY